MQDVEALTEGELADKIAIHENTIYFASGSNHPGEMHGFAQLGEHYNHQIQFGIAVEE